MRRPAALTLLVWFALAADFGWAQGILPVDPITGLPIASSITVSLFQGAVDVTTTWLPEPGQAVTIVVNGLASPTISLVPPTDLNPVRTSAYPGQCTNFPNPAPLPPDYPDFELIGNTLTPTDCGGMAVILVDGRHWVVLPQDSDFDGLPDIWEAKVCPGATPNCLAPGQDIDTGPVSGSPCCDGIANFDKYRGFIVSAADPAPGVAFTDATGIERKHIRTDPRQKDLFVHLVNPQCVPSETDPATASLLGGGTTVYPTDGSSLFANLSTLIPGTQVHPLGYRPRMTNYTIDTWVDNLASYSDTAGFTYRAGTDGAISDRQINQYAVYPVLDTLTGRTIQKGLRITECLDASKTSPLGVAGLGSPNGSDNAILYTQRIVNYLNTLITNGGSRRVKYFTFENGAWVRKFTGTSSPPSPEERNFIISKAMEFYPAHEMGHSVRLTPTVEGTQKTSYGYHHAPGTGSNLDQAIVQKIDRSTSGYNSFYIPLLYNSADQGAFKLKE